MVRGSSSRRADALRGSHPFWARGPGPLLQENEEPVGYAHYELVGYERIVGVFLTSRHLFMLDLVSPGGDYVRRPGVPLSDIVLVRRVRRLPGGWAYSHMPAVDPQWGGPQLQAHSWMLRPRGGLLARVVSRAFVRELKSRLDQHASTRPILLSRIARSGASFHFDREMLDAAMETSPELRRRIQLATARQAAEGVD
jgi:hypothetical protein